MRIPFVLVAALLLAGCAGHETQLDEYRASLGPWSHAVAINESVAIARNGAYYVPFAASNRTPDDRLNASYEFAATNGTIQACLFPASAGEAWNAQPPAAGNGCTSGASGGAEGVAIERGNYTLGLRCNAPTRCLLTYSLRIEGTGEQPAFTGGRPSRSAPATG